MAGGQLIWLLIEHFVFTALPVVAAVLLTARLGVKSVPVLLATGLAASAAAAMLTFWAYYGDPLLGESVAYLFVFGGAGVSAWILFERKLESRLLRQLATPLALWFLGTAFVLFFGFLHGGTDNPLGTAATRSLGQLPSDNVIPAYFAEWYFQHGHHGPPPIFGGEWLSSDRPPLQVGYVLGQRQFGWDTTALHYQVIGTILQQLWIVGVWALLLAARVGRTTRGLAIVAVLVSDLVFVNGFFIWPKMLPAAMLLGAAALVMTPLWSRLRHSLWAAALLAALCGAAIMGHGSSVFGIVPLALIAAWRGLPSWRWLGVAVAVGLLFMAPWSAYQKYADPPGNRLVKYFLAGEPDFADHRGVSEAILDAYGEVGFGGALHYKGQNYVTMVGGGPALEALERGWDAVKDGDWDTALMEVRVVYFFDLLPSLGLLLLGPIAMALAWRRGRRRPREWSFALNCFAVLAIGAIAWGLLMFGNLTARTVVHAGTFLLPILGFCGCVAGLRAVFPRFAIWWVALSAATMLAIYTPSLDPLPETSYSILAILLMVASLAAFAALALRASEPDLEFLGYPGGVAVEDPDPEGADGDEDRGSGDQSRDPAGGLDRTGGVGFGEDPDPHLLEDHR
jgi:hypothetical protein